MSAQYFDVYSTFRDAILEVIGRAERELIVFDADLRDTGIESLAGIEALESLCRRTSAPDSIRILVQDSGFIERDSPRLLSLCGRFGHRMRIRVLPPAYRSFEQPFVIADGQHMVIRFHQDSSRGKFCFDCGSDCAKLTTDHETLWSVSENGPSGIPLGI